MPEPPARYTKLPGHGWSWEGRAQLWVAADHLLQVTSTTATERYRRFYLREIAAIVVQRTKMRLIWNCVFGGVGFLALLIGAVFLFAMPLLDPKADAVVPIRVFAGIFASPAVPLLILLAINTALGPMCACYVHSGGGVDRLAAPTRLGRARRLLRQLAPIIESAQAQAPRAMTTGADIGA